MIFPRVVSSTRLNPKSTKSEICDGFGWELFRPLPRFIWIAVAGRTSGANAAYTLEFARRLICQNMLLGLGWLIIVLRSQMFEEQLHLIKKRSKFGA